MTKVPERTERGRLLDEIEVLATRVAVQGLSEQTSSLLDSNVTLQQFRVLLIVYGQGPLPISRVAEMLHLRPSDATGLVQRLVNRQLIERREDTRDRRIRMLSVTQRGLDLIEETSLVVHAKQREKLERLGDQRLRQLRDILVDLAG